MTVLDVYTTIIAEVHPDGFRHYEDIAQNQSILPVRTDNEGNLSAPISFDSLKNEALPLNRKDNLEAVEMIRVPLIVGIRFVAKLFLGEEAAFPALVMSTIPKNEDHLATKRDSAAIEYAEQKFQKARGRNRITPFSTAAEVRKAMLITPTRPEEQEHPPDYYLPEPFVSRWI